MKKKVALVSILFLLVFLLPNTASAQFTAEHHYVGPSIGLSFLGSAVQFGANYEYGLELQNVGTVGIGGLVRYWSYSEAYGKYTNFLIGAQGNYHFKIPDNDKLDPYVGIVLADDINSWSWNDKAIAGYSYSAGFFWIGLQGGLRYWLSPNLAITGRVGFGSSSYGDLDVGVDFKL